MALPKRERLDEKGALDAVGAMVATDLFDFPLDETLARVNTLRELLPPIGQSLVEFGKEIHIRRSANEASDHRAMVQADHFVESLLLGQLAERFPRDQIISEESGPSGGSGDFAWWVDPVDGTRNFIHGLPLYAISCGIAWRDRPVGGVVYLPATSECYHAVLTTGAYKHDELISVSSVDSIDRALIAMGLPYNRKEIITELIGDISAFVATGMGLRRSGSAVIDLCWVAEGRFDALWDRSMKPWDLCASGVILEEAGGQLTDFDFGPFHLHLREVVASNSLIHEAVLDVLDHSGRAEGYN